MGHGVNFRGTKQGLSIFSPWVSGCVCRHALSKGLCPMPTYLLHSNGFLIHYGSTHIQDVIFVLTERIKVPMREGELG